jgi:hypothetical protein
MKRLTAERVAEIEALAKEWGPEAAGYEMTLRELLKLFAAWRALAALHDAGTLWRGSGYGWSAGELRLSDGESAALDAALLGPAR